MDTFGIDSMNNKGQGTITKRANKKGFSYQAKVKVDGNYFQKTFLLIKRPLHTFKTFNQESEKVSK